MTMKLDCPLHIVTCGRKVAAMSVVERKFLGGSREGR